MAKRAKQVQQPGMISLWGRLRPTKKTSGKRAPVGPVMAIRMPNHRPLTVKDKLWTVAESGRRVYVPMVVHDDPGKFAGREWCHCGPTDGVMVVPWALRDIADAPLHWVPLSGNVCIVEAA